MAADDRVQAFAAVTRALRNLAEHQPAAVDEALVDAFPWLDLLPGVDRRSFSKEFCRAVAAADLDSYAALSQLLHEWRVTAEVHADPTLARRLRRPGDADDSQVTVRVWRSAVSGSRRRHRSVAGASGTPPATQ